MLVLSRRIGEELVIGDDIRVKVVRCQGNRATLGIEAPPHVSITREELLESLRFALDDEESVSLPRDARQSA